MWVGLSAAYKHRIIQDDDRVVPCAATKVRDTAQPDDVEATRRKKTYRPVPSRCAPSRSGFNRKESPRARPWTRADMDMGPERQGHRTDKSPRRRQHVREALHQAVGEACSNRSH